MFSCFKYECYFDISDCSAHTGEVEEYRTGQADSQVERVNHDQPAFDNLFPLTLDEGGSHRLQIELGQMGVLSSRLRKRNQRICARGGKKNQGMRI